MELIDNIQAQVRRLPKKRQQEVLDFVEFLLAKCPEAANRNADLILSRALLAAEMVYLDGEEDTQAPTYSIAEIKATERLTAVQDPH